MVVLEREDRARARGARVYATVDGYGSTCDAYHRVQMDPDGEQIVRAMRLAIERSGRAVEEIGYVNYHGTSTMLNDAVEARCVRELLGPGAARTPGSSTKSMIGHPQGASGAAGIVTTALAMATASCRRRSTSTTRIRSAISIFIPSVGRASRAASPRSATVSASDRRTARSCWDGRRPRQLIASRLDLMMLSATSSAVLRRLRPCEKASERTP